MLNRSAVVKAKSLFIFSALFEKSSHVKSCLFVHQSGHGGIQPLPETLPAHPHPLYTMIVRQNLSKSVHKGNVATKHVKTISEPANAFGALHWFCSSWAAGTHVASWTLLKKSDAAKSFQEMLCDESLSDYNNPCWKWAAPLWKRVIACLEKSRQMKIRITEVYFFLSLSPLCFLLTSEESNYMTQSRHMK